MAPLQFLQPLSGLALAAIVLDERLTWGLAVGAGRGDRGRRDRTAP